MTWIDGVNRRDLTGLGHHNGTFSAFYGVVLHVNVSGKTSQGTSPDWYAAGGGPDEVCPNFQVMRDGTVWQLLPMDVQPWTQADGNFNYASIETGGDPDQPLTDAQLASCALIVKAYHDQMGMPLQQANAPGERGLGVHSMGGAAWGGHPCPGPIRSSQRTQILALASPTPNLLEQIVALDRNSADYKQLVADIASAVVGQTVHLTPPAKDAPVGAVLNDIHLVARRMETVVDGIAQKVGS
jgi:hypothetical protein